MAVEKTNEEMRDEYLSRVSTLFEQAKLWTGKFDPEATFLKETIEIKEEPVGSYQTNVLVINRPDREPIRLLPRGYRIIGAEGRVDLKSALGTETLVYVLEGGPAIRFSMETENGKILDEDPVPVIEEVSEGWALIQNRLLGMLPKLDITLFCRLLEVLGR